MALENLSRVCNFLIFPFFAIAIFTQIGSSSERFCFCLCGITCQKFHAFSLFIGSNWQRRKLRPRMVTINNDPIIQIRRKQDGSYRKQCRPDLNCHIWFGFGSEEGRDTTWNLRMTGAFLDRSERQMLWRNLGLYTQTGQAVTKYSYSKKMS